MFNFAQLIETTMNSTAKDALTGNLACLAAYLIFGFNIVCCKNIANDGHVPPMSRFLMRSAGALSIFPRMRIIMRKLCFIVRSAKYLTVMLLTALWTMSEPAAASAPDRMEIWFDRPAALKGARIWSEPQSGMMNPDPEWESSTLPIGNGFFGANIGGGVALERITLNEKSLWRGGPGVPGGASYYWDVNRQSADAFRRIRKAFAEGDLTVADSLTRHCLRGTASYETGEETPFRFGSFTTMGELTVETDAGSGDVSDYRRSLSLDDAVVSVHFKSGGVRYGREYFVSYPDRVMVMRFCSDTLQRLKLAYTPNPEADVSIDAADGPSVLYRGRLRSNGMRFAVRITALTVGGRATAADDGSISVSESGDVVFVIAAATDYRMNFDPDFTDSEAYVGEDPAAATGRMTASAVKRGYDSLLSRHKKDYRSLFGRVRLSLGPEPEEAGGDPASMPLPERLERYRRGCSDPGLEELYFQYGRYLLIASSRPGAMPANLQGLWHNGVDGPWHVDYHNNINIQMNYWPALVTGLEECCRPLTDYIRTLEKPGERVASDFFGADGWTASISGNIFGFASPLSSTDMSWNLIPVAGPWLATHLWEYYQFTQDRKWLKETGYPLIKGSAEFLEDYLWKSPDGTYTACPSTSPEHGPVDVGVTFAHAVARELLEAAVSASAELDRDAGERERWTGILDSIAPYRIGRYGQLMEWSRDIDDPGDRHRHVNHLFGLHPGHTVSPVTTPALAEACRVTLEHRGDLATGWSMAWKLNQWARLHDGDRAYRLLRNLLSEGTTDNLWCIHPPFQIDGNFGGCAGIAEMLLQSQMGFIHLLPALPEAWSSGAVEGLRARGGFILSFRWKDGAITECCVYSASGKPCRILYRGQYLDLPAEKGRTFRLIPSDDGISLKISNK